MYAACLLRKSQNTNKVDICQIQSRFICEHVMQRQEINISLPCSCKVGEKWLCRRTYSGITRNRPARPGLLYLFIVGGQCHTRPLMHVPGVLGCCAPVLNTVWMHPTLTHMAPNSLSVSKGDSRWWECRHINFNTLLPKTNGYQFAVDIFKCVLLNEDVWISN